MSGTDKILTRSSGHAGDEGEAKFTRPAFQCCLVCGRTLTDRALRDESEGRVLAAIRSEHPEWAEGVKPAGRVWRITAGS